MMKKLSLIFIFLSILSLGCKKEKIDIPQISVTDFKSYTATDYISCDEPVNHEGELIRIDCYVQALNTFENEFRFHLFDAYYMSGTRIEVKIIDEQRQTIEKLLEGLDLNDIEAFSKIRIIGKIEASGTWIPNTSHCEKLPYLVIDSPEDIVFIKD